MFPDIPWIADPMGIGGISNSYDASNAITKVGRVLRLVRLVRLVKLYKIMQIRSRKAKEEKELMQKVKSGQVSFEDIAAQRAAMVMSADGKQTWRTALRKYHASCGSAGTGDGVRAALA